MTEPLARRALRIAYCLFEPSGVRAYQLLRGRRSAKTERIELPLLEEIPAIVPPEPCRFDYIPEIIFQTWKSRIDIPANYRYWRSTFVTHNPQADVILWDDADNRAFIEQNFAWFLPVYDSYRMEIFRADAVRYFFLFAFGGLYADMDSECLRPLQLGQRNEAVALGAMGFDRGFEHAVPNALMASRPRQAFWLLVITRMLEVAASNPTHAEQPALSPETMTGPVLLKRTYDEFRRLNQAALRARISSVCALLNDAQHQSVQFGSVTLHHRNTWYPLDWTNPFHKKLRDHLRQQHRLLSPQEAQWIFPRAELVTYWSHSW